LPKKAQRSIEDLLKSASGIRLDIGCGRWKQGPDWVGLDMVADEGVDIVWDVNRHPWPLPDECCIMVVCSHFVEHIPPCLFDEKRGTWFPFLEFMNEVWRIMKPDGELAIATPHGYSIGFLQDPTHVAAMHEATWAYFDPLERPRRRVV